MYSLKVITREIRFCRSKIGFKNVLNEFVLGVHNCGGKNLFASRPGLRACVTIRAVKALI